MRTSDFGYFKRFNFAEGMIFQSLGPYKKYVLLKFSVFLFSFLFFRKIYVLMKLVFVVVVCSLNILNSNILKLNTGKGVQNVGILEILNAF